MNCPYCKLRFEIASARFRLTDPATVWTCPNCALVRFSNPVLDLDNTISTAPPLCQDSTEALETTVQISFSEAATHPANARW
jgi:hypothetical protein